MRLLLRLFRRLRREPKPLPPPAPAAVRGHFYGDLASAGRVRHP